MNEKVLLNFDASQLSEDQRDIIECIGIENYYKLMKRYGGCSIYISKADSIDKECRNRMIIDEFNNGATYRELAIKYGLTSVWVKNIVNGKN